MIQKQEEGKIYEKRKRDRTRQLGREREERKRERERSLEQEGRREEVTAAIEKESKIDKAIEWERDEQKETERRKTTKYPI